MSLSIAHHVLNFVFAQTSRRLDHNWTHPNITQLHTRQTTDINRTTDKKVPVRIRSFWRWCAI